MSSRAQVLGSHSPAGIGEKPRKRPPRCTPPHFAEPGKNDDAPKKKSLGRRLTPYIAVAAIALAAFLLYRTLSRYSMAEIAASVAAIPAHRLFFAAGFGAASYLCLTFFDYLALRYVGHPLPYRKAALASFVALSMGHNIGLAALSSGTIRYRFYSRWGLSAGEVAKVVLFCGMTVGLGLVTLGGAALIMRASLAEDITGLDRPLVIGLGALCLAAAAGYVALAALVGSRSASAASRWRCRHCTSPSARSRSGRSTSPAWRPACTRCSPRSARSRIRRLRPSTCWQRSRRSSPMCRAGSA